MSSATLLGLTLLFMVIILIAFSFARQRQREDPVQAAALDYRRKVGGPLGLLPSRMDPVGMALTAVTAISGVVALVLLIMNSEGLVFACGVMIVSNLFGVRRDKKWLDNDEQYQAILAGSGN